jgi:hypothetical protein
MGPAQQQEIVSLHDIVGGQASTWLEESRVHFEEVGDNNAFSPLRVATCICCAVILLLWGRRHHLRQRRRPYSGEDVEEVIFVLGIPLLIHRRSPGVSRQGHLSPTLEEGV